MLAAVTSSWRACIVLRVAASDDQPITLASGLDVARAAQPFRQQDVAPVRPDPHDQLVAAERDLERIVGQARQLDRYSRRALPLIGGRNDRRWYLACFQLRAKLAEAGQPCSPVMQLEPRQDSPR